MFPSTEPDAFGQGGITYQLDHHLRALQHATWLDDARLYCNLVCEVAVILRPKLETDEYHRLKNVTVDPNALKGVRRRDQKIEYERALFRAARENLAELLLIASRRGIYAKEDASPLPTTDASEMALK